MRQLFLFLFAAALILGSPFSACRSSERNQPTEAGSALQRGSLDVATLKTLLGASFQTTTTEHFAFLHETNAAYIAQAGTALEHAYRQFYESFSQTGFDLTRTSDRLIWICFPQQSGFNQYALQAEGMDLSWLDGYYSTLTNRVAVVQANPRMPNREEVNPPLANGMRVTLAANRQTEEGVLPMSAAEPRLDVARLTHELAHQLAFNSGLQKRVVMYPLWVSEGLATNFEFDWPPNAGLARGNTLRCNSLVEAHAAGELVSLRRFIVQTRAPADAKVSRRYYAQAWAFFRYILTERSEDLRHYLRRMAEMPPGRREAAALLAEFTEAFGRPEALEPSWNAFLDRQTQQARQGDPASSSARDARTTPLP
jgi:hypothetical protein